MKATGCAADAGGARSRSMLRVPKFTAQVANGAEAYVAVERELSERKLDGQSSVAEIWHTVDRGRTWHPLPWRRSAWVFVSRGLFARWPPEWVNRMWLQGTSLMIQVREDWGMGGPGEPIWNATWDGARWRIRFDRTYRVEVDGSILPPAIELDLPGITTPPSSGPFR